MFSIAFAGLAAVGAPTANQLAYVVQAEDYHLNPIKLSYGASASLAGFIAGPFGYPPLFAIFGRTSTVFWGLVAQLLTQIWAAKMTDPQNYVPFIISRLFSGLLGSIPIAAGSGFIVDAFFLHQRGRLFAFFELVFLIGVYIIPTIGGFIVDNESLGWPWTFWWTCFLLGVACLLVFVFVEDTNYDRNKGTCVRPPRPFVANRVDTILRGWRVVPKTNMDQLVSILLQTSQSF